MSGRKILIYGIGNPYLCDDGIGIRAAEEISKHNDDPDVAVKWGSIDGVAVLDEITGYDYVIIIDSVKSGKGKPGDIYRIIPADSKSLSFSSHGINFITAIRYGKKFDLKMPDRIEIFAVEIEDNTTFSEELTEKVKESLPKVVKAVLHEIAQ